MQSYEDFEIFSAYIAVAAVVYVISHAESMRWHINTEAKDQIMTQWADGEEW